MARPQFSTARLRARRSQRLLHLPPAGDLDSGWLELGGAELRLRKDDGDVVWSAALPGLTLVEFAADDLASLAGDEDPEEATLEPI